MKELTIQEKARRYDEAIKLVNSKWHYKNQPCFIDVSEIFPEIKETKDKHIRKWFIEYFQQYKSEGIEKFDNIIKVDDILAWLEKQGENPQVKSILEIWKNMRFEIYQQASGNRHEPNYSTDNTKMFSLNDIDEIIEKMNEQKPADKVEPKFHEGDWVIDKQGIVHQITNVIENVTYHTYGYDVVGGGYFNDDAEEVRLWTIQDAKDGDVLVASDGSIFIYKYQRNNSVVYYIAVTSCNDLVINENDYSWENKNACHPATKEQRELLFAKMKEAGYEWDNIKHKLVNNNYKPEYCYILSYSLSKIFEYCITEDEVELNLEELLRKHGLNVDECSFMYSSDKLNLEPLED